MKNIKIKHKIAKKSNREEEKLEDEGKMKKAKKKEKMKYKVSKEEKYENMRRKVFGIKKSC